MTRALTRMRPAPAAMTAWLCLAACQSPTADALPSASDVAGYYEHAASVDAEITGNVAVVRVRQNAQDLRRGGALWAKVGPYVFLFTEETQRLFRDYPGLAGVRFQTMVGDARVATALLARDALTDVLWRRALNIAGRARRDGTERVTLLEDLVEWGETHTDFEYSSRYIRR